MGDVTSSVTRCEQSGNGDSNGEDVLKVGCLRIERWTYDGWSGSVGIFWRFTVVNWTVRAG